MVQRSVLYSSHFPLSSLALAQVARPASGVWIAVPARAALLARVRIAMLLRALAQSMSRGVGRLRLALSASRDL